MPLDTKTVFTALGIDAGIGACLLLLFSVLRLLTFTARFYSPYRFRRRRRARLTAAEPHGVEDSAADDAAIAQGAVSHQDSSDSYYAGRRWPHPLWLPCGPFGWLWATTVPEHEVLHLVGLDVTVYLRCLRLGLYITLLLSLWCCAVILPVNITGGNIKGLAHTPALDASQQRPQTWVLGPGALGSEAHTAGTGVSGNSTQASDLNLVSDLRKAVGILSVGGPNADPSMAISKDASVRDSTSETTSSQDLGSSAFVFTDFDRLSLSNIKAGSPKLWVHLASVYVITALVLLLLWRECKIISVLHVAYLAGVLDSPQQAVDSYRQGIHAPNYMSVASRTVLVTDIPGTPSGTKTRAAKQLLWIQQLHNLLPRKQDKHIQRGTSRAQHQLDMPGEQQCEQNTPTVPHASAMVLDMAAGEDGDASERKQNNTSMFQLEQQLSAHRRAEGILKRGTPFPVMVLEELQAVYGQEEVVGLLVLPSLAHVGRLAQAYQRVRTSLENVLDTYASRMARGKHVKRLKVRITPVLLGSWAVEAYGSTPCAVDALTFHLAHLEQLKEQLDAARASAGHASRPGLTPSWFTGQSTPEVAAAPVSSLAAQAAPCKQHSAAVADMHTSPAHAPAAHTASTHDGCHPGAVGVSDEPEEQTEANCSTDLTAANRSSKPLTCNGSYADGRGISNHQAVAQISAEAVTETPSLGMRAELEVNQQGQEQGQQQRPAAHPVQQDVDLSVRTWQQAAACYHPTALVTFRSRYTAAVAAACCHSHDSHAWRVMTAPEPADVIWPALAHRMWYRQWHGRILWLVFWAIVLIYIIPVLALQGLLQVKRMESVPVLQRLVSIRVVRSILSGILPGLVLRVLLLVMPALLRMMVRRSGTCVSWGQLDARTTTLYFIIQVATVYLSSFVAGTLLNQLTQFIQHPPSILTVLGTGAPQVASFFILYIIFNTFITKPLAHLRIVGLLVYCVRYGLAATPRSRHWLWAQQEQPFAPLLPDHTMTLLLVMVFCCVNPLIAPAALLYFIVVLVLQSYQQLYVWRRQYESGGRIWKQVFLQVMVGMYFCQLTMLGLLGVKRFSYAPLLLPLLAATILFHIRVASHFSQSWKMLALRDARDLDNAKRGLHALKPAGEQPPGPSSTIHVATTADLQANETTLYYKVPELVVGKDDAHHQLVAEVEAFERHMQRGEFLRPHARWPCKAEPLLIAGCC